MVALCGAPWHSSFMDNNYISKLLFAVKAHPGRKFEIAEDFMTGAWELSHPSVADEQVLFATPWYDDLEGLPVQIFDIDGAITYMAVITYPKTGNLFSDADEYVRLINGFGLYKNT